MSRSLKLAATVLMVLGLAASPARAAPGDLDSTFGGDGTVDQDFFVVQLESLYATAVLSDGDIVAAGTADNGADREVYVVRLNSNGTVDMAFGTNGVVRIPFDDEASAAGNYSAQAHAVLVHSEGTSRKIVVAGSGKNGTQDGRVADDLVLAQLTDGGQLDPSFGGGDGKAWRSDFAANAIVRQSDGKLVLAGRFDDGSTVHGALARFDTAGGLDTSFGTSGFAKDNPATDPTMQYYALAEAPGGKLVAAGGSTGFAVTTRRDSNGALDTSFNGGGRSTTFFGTPARGLVVKPDGRIVVTGGDGSFRLEGYTGGGAYDTTFGPIGTGQLESTGFGSPVAMSPQADGKLVVLGRASSPDRFVLARYPGDGSTIDTGFGDFGKVETSASTFGGGSLLANGLAIQPNGRILAVGALPLFASDPAFGKGALARYLGGPPDTTITFGPSEGSTTSSKSASFQFTSTQASSSFECKLDGGSFQGCTSPKTYSGLSLGNHTFEVRATDDGGAVDPTPASRSWTVAETDTTPPDTSITAGPSGLTNRGAEFSFISDEGDSTFECRLDGGSFEPCSSPKAYPGLTDGAHSFEVRARDAAGNLDPTPASRSWTQDTAAPETTIVDGPGPPSVNARFTLDSSESPPIFQCRVDGGDFQSCVSPHVVALPAGSHTLDVRALDAAGNVDPTPASTSWVQRPCLGEVSFGPIEAVGGCFIRDGVRFTVTGRFRLNGLQIDVPTTGEVVLDTAAGKITSKGNVAVSVGPYDVFGVRVLDRKTLYRGELNLDKDLPGFGFSRTISLQDSKVGGIPVTGTLGVGPEGGAMKFRVALGLPNFLGGFTAETAVRLTNEPGIELDRIKATAAKLGPLPVENVSLSFDFPNRLLEGSAKVVLPKLSVESALALQNCFFPGGCKFRSASANVDGLNIPLDKGVFLQRIRFAIALEPLELKGGIGISAGPQVLNKEAVGIDADLTLRFTDPAVYRMDGRIRLADLEAASGFAEYVTSGKLALGANVNWVFVPSEPLPIVGRISELSVSAALRGYVDRDLAFALEGRGTLRASYLTLLANAIVSNLGAALCAGVEVDVPLVGKKTIYLGAGYTFETRAVSIMAPSCDLGPWRPAGAPVAARAAQGERVMSVPRGLELAAIAVEGRDSPPQITITAPNGERATTPTDPDRYRQGRFVFLPFAHDKTTYVVIARPPAGNYRISLEPGSSSIASTRRAAGLPPPSVRAKVRRVKRSRARVLQWRLKPLPGQRVTFTELGPETSRVLGRTRARRGSLRFRPGDGRGGRRRIVALVEQHGLPRAQLTVASYKAPPPLRPGRIRRVGATRRRSRLRLRWSRARRASMYEVQVRVSDGRRLLMLPSRRSVTITGFDRRESARIVVRAMDDRLRRGRPARARVKPQRRSRGKGRRRR